MVETQPPNNKRARRGAEGAEGAFGAEGAEDEEMRAAIAAAVAAMDGAVRVVYPPGGGAAELRSAGPGAALRRVLHVRRCAAADGAPPTAQYKLVVRGAAPDIAVVRDDVERRAWANVGGLVRVPWRAMARENRLVFTCAAAGAAEGGAAEGELAPLLLRVAAARFRHERLLVIVHRMVPCAQTEVVDPMSRMSHTELRASPHAALAVRFDAGYFSPESGLAVEFLEIDRRVFFAPEADTRVTLVTTTLADLARDDSWTIDDDSLTIQRIPLPTPAVVVRLACALAAVAIT